MTEHIPGVAPVSPELDDTERRIVEATIELATLGGYEAVRQRDVAARAGVALATVYSRFHSKDMLIAAALEVDSRDWVGELHQASIEGHTPQARVTKLFESLTAVLLRRPELLRASMRVTASADRQVLLRQMVGYQRILSATVAALRGSETAPALDHGPAQRVAAVLVMVWYSNLTTWSAGLMDPATVVETLRDTTDLLLNGVR